MYEPFWAGAGGVVLGALITVLLTFWSQRCLLQQQLEFLKRQTEEDAKLRKAIHEETIKSIASIQTSFVKQFQSLASQIEGIANRPPN